MGDAVIPHTPGPWRAEHGKRIVASNGYVVAEIPDAHHMLNETTAANAQLLAHAPPLLEMARRLLEWQARMGGWESPVWDDLCALLDKIDGTEVPKIEE